jgi:DNA-binding SARP family transcriptional activator
MEPAALLRLTLFGSFAVSVHDTAGASRAVPLSGRPGSLLAYLALSRGRLSSRGELTSTLWAERGNGAAAGTFNTTLWRLRKAIERPPLRPGDLIVCDRRGAVGLKDRAHLTLDVEEFAHLVIPALAKPLASMTELDVEALQRGVSLYAGDVLAGFSDEWALREREKHRRHQLNSLGRLIEISALARDAAAAIRYAQAILDLDSLREDVHRELMHFYLLAGQRAMALRQFEICRAALKRELAIQPMRETMAMYRRIADSAVGMGVDTEPEAPAAGPVSLAVVASAALLAAPAAAAATDLMAAERIASARRYLAAADAQLQLALPLFDPPAPGVH